MSVKIPPPPEVGTRLRHLVWGWGVVQEQRTYHHNTVSLLMHFDLHGEREAVWKFIWDRVVIDDATVNKFTIVDQLRRAHAAYVHQHPYTLAGTQSNYLQATPPSAAALSQEALLAAVQRAIAFLEM